MPQVAGIACTLVLACALGFPPAASAGIVIVNNRIIRTDVDSPYLPNDRSECEDFRKTVQETRDEVHKAHEACLASNRGGSSSSEVTSTTLDGRKIQRCSVAACQELHTARDDLAHSASTGYSRCMAEVRSREADTRQSFGSGRGDDFDYAIGRLKGTELAMARRLVRDKLSEIIGSAFGVDSRFVRQGLKVGETADFLWQSTDRVQGSCNATREPAIARECSQQIFTMVQQLQSLVPARLRGNPAIGLIRIAVAERAGLVLRDVGGQAEGMQEDLGAFSGTHSTPSRGGRRGALIENR